MYNLILDAIDKAIEGGGELSRHSNRISTIFKIDAEVDGEVIEISVGRDKRGNGERITILIQDLLIRDRGEDIFYIVSDWYVGLQKERRVRELLSKYLGV